MPFQLVQGLGTFGTLCLLCADPARIGDPETGRAPFWAVQPGFVYSSFERSLVETTASAGGQVLADGGDTTPHIEAFEISRVWPSEGRRGGGVPRGEVAIGVATAATHNEGGRLASADVPQIATTGNGRFESVWFRGRLPVGRSGSLELAIERPYFTEADVIVTGTDLYLGASLRNLLTDTRNVAGGYRFFGRRFDVALHVLWTNIRTQWGTAKSFLNQRGDAWGAELDGEAILGDWWIAAACGAESGRLRTQGGFYPDFSPYENRPIFRRRYVFLRAGRPFGRLNLTAAAGGVFLDAPSWDSGGITSTESYWIDEGRSYLQTSKQLVLELGSSYRFSETVSAEAGVQRVVGDENASFQAAIPGVIDRGASFSRRGWTYRLGLGFQIH